MTHEHPSPSVAKLAGRMLKRLESAPSKARIFTEVYGRVEIMRVGTVAEVMAICAALTAPDKRKKSK